MQQPADPQEDTFTPAGGQTAFEVATEAFLWQLAPPEDPSEQGPASTDLPAVQDDDDLDRVLRDYFGVKLPHVKCCQTHSTPWDAFHDAFFARSIMSIWKASRGLGGKSFTLSALTIAEALFLRADVNILGGSGEQAKRVLESIGTLWGMPGAPKQCLLGLATSQKQRLVWGNRIVALMASQTSVRGPHPQRLRLDEVDEMKLEILNSSLGQPMTKGWIASHVVMSSTHQYPDGTMTKMLKRAAAEGWPVFEWCYLENLEPHGWLSQSEVARKKALLTKAMWETEIELQEPSSEGRAIDTAKVEAAFVPNTPLATHQNAIIFEAPDPAGKYATGGDWAKKKNHTVIVTIRTDVKPRRVVMITRTQKEPWPTMVGYYDAQVKLYGGSASHDNTGIGQVVHDLLTVNAEPFDMVGRQRADLLSEYVAAVEKGDLIWPRFDDHAVTQACYGEHKYATREDLYKGSKDGTGKHHLPDTISAAALAWRAATIPEGASEMAHQNLPNAPHLQAGFTRGRLSAFAKGGRDVDVVPAPEPPVQTEQPTGRPRLSIFEPSE